MPHKNNKHNNEERRNYYRTLNVQPDAPLESIKNNYRTLLQKLKLHPDLGGEEWNASIINEAYNVLRDSKKRAAYDKELLKRYDLKSLSRGNLVKKPTFQTTKSLINKDRHGNKRNFYRLFNIQPDSSKQIVKTTYLSLVKNSNKPKELLDEAYAVLSNPDKRALYDKLLSRDNHAYALKKLIPGQHNKNEKLQTKTKQIHNAFASTLSNSVKIKKSHVNSIYGDDSKKYYQPVITQYCTFCKTPHNQSPCKHTAALCNDCKSPLFPPSKTFLEQQRRDVIRLSKNSTISFYAYWPGKKITGYISDISPTGVQLLSSKHLNKDQIIKLDGDDFKAVGMVSYSKENYEDDQKMSQISGIKFLTVNFNKSKGQFFSESA